MSGLEIAAAAGLASAAVGGVSSFAASQAQARAAEFNAEMAQQQAERERQIAARDAETYRRRESRLLAASRASRAGSGVTFQGSPLLVDEATAAEIELGAQNILAGGAASAFGFQQQAALSRARARSTRTGAFLSAGSTLLTTVGSRDFSTLFLSEEAET